MCTGMNSIKGIRLIFARNNQRQTVFRYNKVRMLVYTGAGYCFYNS